MGWTPSLGSGCLSQRAFYVFADVTGTGMSDVEFADGALGWRPMIQHH